MLQNELLNLGTKHSVFIPERDYMKREIVESKDMADVLFDLIFLNVIIFSIATMWLKSQGGDLINEVKHIKIVHDNCLYAFQWSFEQVNYYLIEIVYFKYTEFLH